MIPKYKSLYLTDNQIRKSIHFQLIAHHHPELINWPPEPWQPISGLDLILHDIRDYGKSF